MSHQPDPITIEFPPAEVARLHLLAEVFEDLVIRRPHPDLGDPAPILRARRRLEEALEAAGYRLDDVGWRIPDQEPARA